MNSAVAYTIVGSVAVVSFFVLVFFLIKGAMRSRQNLGEVSNELEHATISTEQAQQREEDHAAALPDDDDMDKWVRGEN